MVVKKTTKMSASGGKASKVAAPKVSKNTASKQVVEPTVEPVVEAPAEVESTLPSHFSDFMTKLQQVNSLLSGLRTEFRALERKATRELKAAQKASARRKRKSGNRSPSGFVKPTLISNELATFLGKELGSEMARTEVTREINAYIRKHSLQDKSNGRKIIPDAPLQKLLKLKKSDELTYFNLQRYMSPHFAKAGQAPLAS